MEVLKWFVTKGTTIFRSVATPADVVEELELREQEVAIAEAAVAPYAEALGEEGAAIALRNVNMPDGFGGAGTDGMGGGARRETD